MIPDNIDPIILRPEHLESAYKGNNTASATLQHLVLLQQYYNKYNPNLITS